MFELGILLMFYSLVAGVIFGVLCGFIAVLKGSNKIIRFIMHFIFWSFIGTIAAYIFIVFVVLNTGSY